MLEKQKNMKECNNNVQLCGQLAGAPEMLKHHNGTFAKLVLVTEDYYLDRKGHLIRNDQAHTLSAWGEDAEKASNLLKKGSKLRIQGKLIHNHFKDKTGQSRTVSEVRILNMQILE